MYIFQFIPGLMSACNNISHLILVQIAMRLNSLTALSPVFYVNKKMII